MTNIELPRDAAGREIPLDTKVLYEQGKDKFNECSYLAYADIAARIRKLRGEE